MKLAPLTTPPRILPGGVVAIDQQVDIYEPWPGTKRAVPAGARLPDYVIDISRPVVQWRWTSVLLAPVELLAVAWGVGLVILLVGIPIALTVALMLWIARFIVSLF